MDTWYITIGGQEIETRPAAGRMRDADWGGRESRAVTIEKRARLQTRWRCSATAPSGA